MATDSVNEFSATKDKIWASRWRLQSEAITVRREVFSFNEWHEAMVWAFLLHHKVL